MRAAALAAVLAALAVGCRSESTGVPVGEAETVRTLPRPRAAPLDTVYADSGLYADPALDSLARRSADSLAAAAGPPEPSFEPAWVSFQASLRVRGPRATPLGRFSRPGPFREGLLALAAREVRRVGTAREAVVRVGYDGAGRVVPQDEADRDSTLTVRFDVVDGAYRLVGVDVRG